MADWVTISSLATAGGTLGLAVATFSSVRSANRSARAAERSLLAGQRPVLIPSRDDDPAETVRFGDAVMLSVPGHGSAVKVHGGNIYMAFAVRNGGTGLAVIHGWQAQVIDRAATGDRPEDPETFRRQQRDLYIPAGSTGFWQGAVRDRHDEAYDSLRAAELSGARITIDILYGDYEGGQRTIARFGITSSSDGDASRTEVLRYWNVDGSDPR
jgi:hypothetical protein